MSVVKDEMEKITSDLLTGEEEFRDSIATVDAKGKRVWVYPKKPKGRLHSWRILVTIVLLGLLFAGPLIRIDGRPFLLFNFFAREFVIFGQPFWPQDFIIFAISLITFFVFIILFTVVFGRVWCGWMCPQTLFMEMVFRKVEYWIEGDAAAQRRLKKQAWNGEKIFKKGIKHSIFIAISLLIAHTVMAYIVGLEETARLITSSPLANPAGFAGLVTFAGVFYFVFALFREQACIAVCPYGRLQGVLLGKESIVVAYDWKRGEPRGHLKRGGTVSLNQGDCIDCKLCVHVCPTGIDIRNGTQLECVNCTACIDACNDVMIKIGKPGGLIRYASYNSIKDGIQKLMTPRVIGYTVILIGLMGVLAFSLSTRSDVKTTVLKVPGTLYQRSEDGLITNLYHFEFLNKTYEDIAVSVKVESPSYAKLDQADVKELVIPAGGLLKRVFFVRVPEKEITNARTEIYVGVYDGERKLETVKVKFIGPVRKASDAKR